MSVDAAPSLRRSLGIVGVGIRREPRWFALAVAGSALYGVMTVLTAWAIGKVTREQIQPAVQAGTVTADQLWAIFGWVAGVVMVNVVGVVIRRVAAGYTMYNVAAGYRREVSSHRSWLPTRAASRARPSTSSGSATSSASPRRAIPASTSCSSCSRS